MFLVFEWCLLLVFRVIVAGRGSQVRCLGRGERGHQTRVVQGCQSSGRRQPSCGWSVLEHAAVCRQSSEPCRPIVALSAGLDRLLPQQPQGAAGLDEEETPPPVAAAQGAGVLPAGRAPSPTF